jgi:uncharacterized protein YgiM (DUF1202 family)
MKLKLTALTLIGVFVFTSLTAFAADVSVNNKTIQPVATAGSRSTLTTNLNNLNNMEYCTVDLADSASNLNVRTWEGRVIGKLRHGTSVFVNKYSGEWARVSVKRGRRWVAVGWVDSTYLYC